MSEGQKQALIELTAHNQITVVADLDHSSRTTKATIDDQLDAMAANGVKHLFLEHDPREYSAAQLIADGGEYGNLAKTASDLGITIHMMDDQTAKINRERRYPNEAEYRNKMDPYLEDKEALISSAPDPIKMRAYLNEEVENWDAEIAFRNVRMAENIANEMDKHPNERALVITGGLHTFKKNDVDEGLRLRGYQTATVEIHAADVSPIGKKLSLEALDRADIRMSASTGAAITYKIPGTNQLESVKAMPEGNEIPWANREPVSDRNHPAMLCALDAAKGLNCSWNHTVSQAPPIHISREETGKMASPSTQRQAASPEPDGPPR